MLWTRALISTSSGFFHTLFFVPVRHRSFRTIRDLMEKGHVPFSEEDYAFNHVEKKKGLLKPRRTVEEQIEYMSSEAFRNVYKDRPVWETWVRNLRNQIKYQPPLRLFCIDRNGRFNVNHACPVCRDEYFFFDYRNTALLKQFLVAGTALAITNKKTGLCIEQQINLQAEVLKAKEHGTLPFNVEFRHFDYAEWYPGQWKPEERGEGGKGMTMFNDAELPSRNASVNQIYPSPDVAFPAHNRDVGTRWDEWWVRHDKFARKGR